MTGSFKGVFYAAVAGLAVGVSAPFFRLGAKKADLLVAATVVAGVAFLGNLLVVFATGQQRGFLLVKNYNWQLLVGGVCYSIANIALLVAYFYVGVAIASSVQRPLAIVGAVILGIIWLKEPLTRLQWLGVVGAIASILLIILGKGSE